MVFNMSLIYFPVKSMKSTSCDRYIQRVSSVCRRSNHVRIDAVNSEDCSLWNY